MAPLGPFEPAPALAVACSGGPDSLALALLASGWVRPLGGSVLALVVDHGLRAESGAEAADTLDRLAGLGIAAALIRLNLAAGPGIAQRARAARHAALRRAAADRGVLHLLFGHHADDQAETVLMRALAGSGAAGLAGMAAVVETAEVRLLRPLLGIPRARLLATVRAAGVGWVQDPSNADPRTLRARLRVFFADPMGDRAARTAPVAAGAGIGRARAAAESGANRALAVRAVLRPEGFALLRPGRIDPLALGRLLRMIAGAPFPPSPAALARLAWAPGPATLAGVRLLPAGRLGPGLLVVREEAAMQPPMLAVPGALWDRRWRIGAAAAPPAGAAIGALGADAARFRGALGLPSAVLRTLPALRVGETLLSVPGLSYAAAYGNVGIPLSFVPLHPAGEAAFVAADRSGDEDRGRQPMC